MTMTTNSIIIENKDLSRRKYDEATLLANIRNFNMTQLLRTQTLSAFLCVRYVMNEDYAADVEEEYYLSLGNVLRFQPHLTVRDLYDEFARWEEEKENRVAG